MPYSRLLAPPDLPSLVAVRSSSNSRRLAYVLLALMFVFVAALIFVPWVQTADGFGKVIAYAPLERQQTIEAPIEGRITHWFVREGSRVQKGDPLVDITDNDPDLMSRLRAERDAVVARIQAAQERASSIEGRIESLGSSRESAVSAASSRAQMATERLRGAEQAVAAAEVSEKTSELNLERQRSLFSEGLASQRAKELAELDYAKSSTDLDRARASLNAARSEQAAIQADRSKAHTDGSASVDDARASRASAMSDVANASAELARIEVRLARQATQFVTAPRDGTILRLVAHQGGEIVKAGDALVVLVPDTNERAVELYVDGNDVPLITEARHVRLQFEGWPAVQFSGWPSVAVGTFGGHVAFVDATDNGKGQFRVVIVHDGSEPWPDVRYLRQGVRAHGWILLNRVRLGYELWRQFNGFPPVITPGAPAAPSDKDAKGKPTEAK